MHLALIEAMYKSKLIGSSETGGQNIKVGNQLGQGNEEPQYFVVGVEKDEWDIKGKILIVLIYLLLLIVILVGKNITILIILLSKISFHSLFRHRSQ